MSEECAKNVFVVFLSKVWLSISVVTSVMTGVDLVQRFAAFSIKLRNKGSLLRSTCRAIVFGIDSSSPVSLNKEVIFSM